MLDSLYNKAMTLDQYDLYQDVISMFIICRDNQGLKEYQVLWDLLVRLDNPDLL